MVVFGAGASYDSVSPRLNAAIDLAVDPLRPPLAAELFAERFSNFVADVPAAAPIVAQMRLASLTGGDVERRLGELQEEVQRYPERATHVAGVRFYLQRLLAAATARCMQRSAGVTNYLLLLDRIVAWQRASGEPILLVTFNYDTLLEEALARILPNWTPALHELMERRDVRLFKPHGSISWARRAALDGLHDGPSDVLQEAICRNVARLNVTRNYVYRGDPLQVTTNSATDVTPLLFPAVAIPVERKASFECPDDHLERFKNVVVDVTRVIVVGWRATEAHFLDVLEKHMAKNRRIALHAVTESRASSVGTEQNLMHAASDVSWIATHYSSNSGFSTFAEDPNPLLPFLQSQAFVN